MKALIVILIIGIILVSGCSNVGTKTVYHTNSISEAHKICSEFCGKEYEPVLEDCTYYLCECYCKKESVFKIK